MNLAQALEHASELTMSLLNGNWDFVESELMGMNQRDALAVALLMSGQLSKTDSNRLARFICQ